MFWNILAIIMALAASGCLVMLWRNEAVYQFRTELLRRISQKADEDIQAGREYEWRYQMFDSITYKDMVMRFWKDLFKFYDLNVLLGDEKPKEL